MASVKDAIAELRLVGRTVGKYDSVVGGKIETIMGDRHGSWMLRLRWQSDGLTKLAEIAITNNEPVEDEAATTAYLCVRAAAASVDRYVSETLYDRSRSAKSIKADMLGDLLDAAINLAYSYNVTSLKDALPATYSLQREREQSGP